LGNCCEIEHIRLPSHKTKATTFVGHNISTQLK
jgi:hypothetical protein